MLGIPSTRPSCSKTVTIEAVVTTGVTLQLLSGSTAIMDASNTGTTPMTGLLSGRRKKIAGGVFLVQSGGGGAVIKFQGATNSGDGDLAAAGVAVEGCTVANSWTMANTGSDSVALSLTANIGVIGFTGSTSDPHRGHGKRSGERYRHQRRGITWVDNGANCITAALEA